MKQQIPGRLIEQMVKVAVHPTISLETKVLAKKNIVPIAKGKQRWQFNIDEMIKLLEQTKQSSQVDLHTLINLAELGCERIEIN